eukprot:scaffold416_cov329-Pavlova_lutheri.AAC.38
MGLASSKSIALVRGTLWAQTWFVHAEAGEKRCMSACCFRLQNPFKRWWQETMQADSQLLSNERRDSAGQQQMVKVATEVNGLLHFDLQILGPNRRKAGSEDCTGSNEIYLRSKGGKEQESSSPKQHGPSPTCQSIASSGRNGCPPLTKSLPQTSKTNACNNLVARCSSTTRRMMPPSALGQAFTKMPDMAKGLLTDTLDLHGRLLKSRLTRINYSYF